VGRSEDWRARASEILTSGVVPTPPVGPLAPGVRHPLAVDIQDGLGAISFAVLDLHPRIAKGMWCEAVVYVGGPDAWTEYSTEDNTTSPRPFERPVDEGTNVDGWVQWHSNGGLAQRGKHDYLTSFFGIAPATTGRLTVTPGGGEERELRVTPYNGAYVAAVPAPSWILTGYSVDGQRLGEFALDHRAVEG
jgi:hypothetical protein